MMMNATRTERALERRTATLNALSVDASKRLASRSSAVKLCTTGMAFNTSAAIALESATRSWLARDNLRTRLPNHRLGNTISTSTPSTCTIT